MFLLNDQEQGNTLPETNIAPENGWLEYYFPIGEAYFQGLRWFQGGYHLGYVVSWRFLTKDVGN